MANNQNPSSLEDVLAASAVTTRAEGAQGPSTAEGAQQGDQNNGTAEQNGAPGAADAGGGENQNGTSGVGNPAGDAGAGAGNAGDGDSLGDNHGGASDSGDVDEFAEDDDTILARMIAEDEAKAAEAVVDTPPLAYTLAVNYETVEGPAPEVELTDEERLPWLFNYGQNRLQAIPQTTRQLWQAFCVDFPGMIGYTTMSPDVTLIPNPHRDLFAARTVEPEFYEPEE